MARSVRRSLATGQQGGAPLLTRALPSGLWRGYYTFSGTRHDVCEFSLEFREGSGHIAGSGTDDVGRYSITGLHCGTRLAFTKQYQAQSTNVAGVVSYGNKGHAVEYRGELAGASLGEGFRGSWTIHSTLGNHTGQFHLWPSMEGFEDSAPAAETGRSVEESECVVCYDRPISVRLRPCGV